MKHNSLTPQRRYRATNLASVLDNRGIKRLWLANRIGVSGGHIANVLYGKRTVTRQVGERIADAVQVPFDLIFEFSDEHAKRSEEHIGKG